MNRREFIRLAGGAIVAATTLQNKAFGHFFSHASDYTDQVRDLILWAPYEPFLPENTHPVLEDPNDGTENGVLKAADIIAGVALTLKFWHGHNGVLHKFTITPENFTSLKSGNQVIIRIPTTVVDDHYHMIVIDPNKPA